MEYRDPAKMFNSMFGFLKRHRGDPNIVRADDPRRLMLGFMCVETGEYWHIPLCCLRNKYIRNRKKLWNYLDNHGREEFIEELRRKARDAPV